MSQTAETKDEGTRAEKGRQAHLDYGAFLRDRTLCLELPLRGGALFMAFRWEFTENCAQAILQTFAGERPMSVWLSPGSLSLINVQGGRGSRRSRSRQ